MRIAVYDVLGRVVAVLVDEVRPAGRHEASLDASAFSNGIYVVRLTAGGARQMRKLLLLR